MHKTSQFNFHKLTKNFLRNIIWNNRPHQADVSAIIGKNGKKYDQQLCATILDVVANESATTYFQSIVDLKTADIIDYGGASFTK